MRCETTYPTRQKHWPEAAGVLASSRSAAGHGATSTSDQPRVADRRACQLRQRRAQCSQRRRWPSPLQTRCCEPTFVDGPASLRIQLTRASTVQQLSACLNDRTSRSRSPARCSRPPRSACKSSPRATASRPPPHLGGTLPSYAIHSLARRKRRAFLRPTRADGERSSP